MRKFFGTSGIRGPLQSIITPELAISLGLSVATHLDNNGSAVVGFDVRTSSKMLEQAVISGLLAGGCNAICIGMTLTPVLAFTTRERGAKIGIMIQLLIIQNDLTIDDSIIIFFESLHFLFNI